MFLYCYLVQGAWRAGWPGWQWARLRAEVYYHLIDVKYAEMKRLGREYQPEVSSSLGQPHPRAMQAQQADEQGEKG